MKLFGYGLINYDDIVRVNNVVIDGKVTATESFRQIGGPVPVALQAYTKLGGESCFFGTVGDDILGEYVVHRIAETISQPMVVNVPNATTSRSVVIIEDTGARTIINIPAKMIGSVDVSSFTNTFEPGCILHVDGRDLETDLLLARAAKTSGMSVSIDLGTMRPGREGLLSLCDIIIASKSGAAGLTPDNPDDINRQLDVMRQFGAQVVGITLAEKGVIIGDQSKTFHLPAYVVEHVIDTNGAGDCFHGAFLYGYANLDQNLQDIAKFAQACVALKISKMGNDAGLPVLSDVMAYLT